MNSSYHSISLGGSHGWFQKTQGKGWEPWARTTSYTPGPIPHPSPTILPEILLTRIWEPFEKRGPQFPLLHPPPTLPSPVPESSLIAIFSSTENSLFSSSLHWFALFQSPVTPLAFIFWSFFSDDPFKWHSDGDVNDSGFAIGALVVMFSAILIYDVG